MIAQSLGRQPKKRSQLLLVQGSVERTGDDSIPGFYCVNRHVWVLDDQPIVSRCNGLADLNTKTEPVAERDDAFPMSLLELQTKTKAQIESDDQEYSMDLLGLATKTDSVTERDD